MPAKAEVLIVGKDQTAAAWSSAIGRGRKAANDLKGYFSLAFAGLSIAAIANAGRQAIKLGDDLQKAAVKAGIGGKAISELAHAAKMADVELSSLSTAIKKMQITLSEAGSGSKGPKEALAALGLTFEQLKNMKADQQFELIGDRISQLKGDADRTRAAVELFGKAGADLLPLFSEGAEGIRKARIEAQRLGVSFSDEQIKRLADADDAIKRLDTAWQGVWTTLVSKVAPALTEVMNASTDGRMEAGAKGFLRGGVTGAAIGVYKKHQSLANDEYDRNRRGVIDRPGDTPPVPGFGPDPAVATAAAAAFAKSEKERLDAAARAAANLSDELWNGVEASAEMQRYFDETAEAAGESTKGYIDDLGESLEKLDIKTPFQDAAKVIGDTLLSAFDNWVAGGKIKTSELVRYMVAQIARTQIASFFDAAAGKKPANSGSSSGGFWSAVGGFFSSTFGGAPKARALGGPMEPGKFYKVGERGEELIRAGSNAHVFPNDALGGRSNSVTWAPTFNLGRGGREEQRAARSAAREQERRFWDNLDRRGLLE